MNTLTKTVLAISLASTLVGYFSVETGLIVLITHTCFISAGLLCLKAIFDTKALKLEIKSKISKTDKTIDLLSLIGISCLTICLLGKTNSPYDYMYLCASLTWFLITKSKLEKLKGKKQGISKYPLGISKILTNNVGPGLLILYCLWLGLANMLNQQTTNLQIPYYLSLGYIALILGWLFQNQKYAEAMVYTMIMTIIASTAQRFIGIEFWSMLPIVNYKNFVAIIGLLALSMLQTFEKNKTNSALSVLTSLCLLINPSILGILGVITLWVIVLWHKMSLDRYNTNKKTWLTIHGIAPPLLAICALAILVPNAENISKLLNKNENLNGRLDVWKTSVTWITKEPIVGNGPNFWLEKGVIAVHNKGTQDHRPGGFNALIDTSVQAGIPAAVLLCLFFFLSLKTTSLNYRQRYILATSLVLSFLTETHSFIGISPNIGEGILVTWLGFVWGKTIDLPKQVRIPIK